MIVITGPGRSGTSFLALLYRELGFDLKGSWTPRYRAGLEARAFQWTNTELTSALGTAQVERRGGRGLRRLDGMYQKRQARLPEETQKRVEAVLNNVRYRRDSLDLLDWSKLDAVVDHYGERLRRLSVETQVVKDPRFCWTLPAWLASGATIDALVMPLRTLPAMVDSRIRAGMIPEEGRSWAMNQFAYGIGLVMAATSEYRVPIEVLRFPDFLDEPRQLHQRLPLPEARTWEEFEAAFEKVHDASLVQDRR